MTEGKKLGVCSPLYCCWPPLPPPWLLFESCSRAVLQWITSVVEERVKVQGLLLVLLIAWNVVYHRDRHANSFVFQLLAIPFVQDPRPIQNYSYQVSSSKRSDSSPVMCNSIS